MDLMEGIVGVTSLSHKTSISELPVLRQSNTLEAELRGRREELGMRDVGQVRGPATNDQVARKH